MGGIFHFDEIIGLEDFFEGFTSEIGDGKDFFCLEASSSENFFYVFGVVVVKTSLADFGIVGRFFGKRIFFGTVSNVAGHFW